jgi:hypothetical protein
MDDINAYRLCNLMHDNTHAQVRIGLLAELSMPLHGTIVLAVKDVIIATLEEQYE